MALKLMYITNNPAVARIAEEAGVDRIFVDMEYIGKADAREGWIPSSPTTQQRMSGTSEKQSEKQTSSSGSIRSMKPPGNMVLPGRRSMR